MLYKPEDDSIKLDYISNKKISEKFGISKTSIINWIDAGSKNENDLEVFYSGKKKKIINNSHNWSVIQNLAEKAVIYRNRISQAQISPNFEFYNYFDTKDLYSFLFNFDYHKSILPYYSNVGEGSKKWLDFMDKLENSRIKDDGLLANLELTRNPFSVSDISSLKEKKQKVNLFIIGPKNVKNILNLVNNLGKYLHKIYLLDNNDNLSKIITEKLLKSKIEAEIIEYDTNQDNFGGLFLSLSKNLNLVNYIYIDYFGLNYYSDLQSFLLKIKKGLRPVDRLISVFEIDNQKNKGSFNFDINKFPSIWLLESVGIILDKDCIYSRYEEFDNSKNIYFKADKDYLISFEQPKYSFKISKNTKILLYKEYLFNKSDLIDFMYNFGLDVCSLSTSDNGYKSLIVSRLSQNDLNVFNN